GLRDWMIFQPDIAFKSWDQQFAAKDRLPRLNLHFVNQIAAIDREIGMLCQTHAQKKIAAFSAAHARFALAGQTDSLPLVNAAWNLDLIVFHPVRTGAAQGDG